MLKRYVEDNSINKLEVFNERLSLIKLFGDENDSEKHYLDEIFKDKSLDEEFKKFLKEKNFDMSLSYRGRLNFYPTFFDNIGYDVITPHKRETGVPNPGPIFLEVVPEKTKGTLNFLYHPFDLLFLRGRDLSKEDCSEILNDIQLIKVMTINLLCEYGFSSKKSSGYGIVDSEQLKGSFQWSEKDKSDELYFDKEYFGLKEVLFNG